MYLFAREGPYLADVQPAIARIASATRDRALDDVVAIPKILQVRGFVFAWP